jgi:hypothetical protein
MTIGPIMIGGHKVPVAALLHTPAVADLWGCVPFNWSLESSELLSAFYLRPLASSNFASIRMVEPTIEQPSDGNNFDWDKSANGVVTRALERPQNK